MIWVEFGCAGHGKGPWDGLGAVIKQMVRRDILHNKILTASGYITSPAEVLARLPPPAPCRLATDLTR
eukprot:7384478-Prymnesium_polylepis.1